MGTSDADVLSLPQTIEWPARRVYDRYTNVLLLAVFLVFGFLWLPGGMRTWFDLMGRDIPIQIALGFQITSVYEATAFYCWVALAFGHAISKAAEDAFMRQAEGQSCSWFRRSGVFIQHFIVRMAMSFPVVWPNLGAAGGLTVMGRVDGVQEQVGISYAGAITGFIEYGALSVLFFVLWHYSEIGLEEAVQRRRASS